MSIKKPILILLLSTTIFTGCIRRIPVSVMEPVPENAPVLTITASPDPATEEDLVSITINSDRVLVVTPTVRVIQKHQRTYTDITHTLQTSDNITWTGTYQVIPGYEGEAVVEVRNVVDEQGNKGWGVGKFVVQLPEISPAWSEWEEPPIGIPLKMTIYDGLYNNYINCILAVDDYFWVGTEYGISNETVTYISKHRGVVNAISSLQIDGDYLWIATKGSGLIRFNMLKNLWSWYPVGYGPYDGQINDLAIDSQSLWLATNRGITKYDKQQNEWIVYTKNTTEGKLLSDKVTKVVIEYPYVWFGTDKGLCRYDPLTDNWSSYTLDKEVTSLLVDGTDLWVGTIDGGLKCYNLVEGIWTASYTIEDGLFSNSILSLAKDTNYIWVGHNKGVSKYDRLSPKWSVFSYLRVNSAIRQLDRVNVINVDGARKLLGMNTGLLDITQSEWVDVTPPEITALSPETDSIYSTGVIPLSAEYQDEPGGSGIDPLSVRIWIDGEDVSKEGSLTITPTKVTYIPTTPLSEQEHTVKVEVADMCGNRTSQLHRFYISASELRLNILLHPQIVGNEPTDVSITINANNRLVSAPCVEVEEKYSQGKSVEVVTHDNGYTWNGTYTCYPSGPGTTTVRVIKAEDFYGNIETATSTLQILTANPKIIGTPTCTVKGSMLEVKGTVTPNVFVTLFIDKSCVNLHNSPTRTVMSDNSGGFLFTNIELSPGNNFICVQASNYASNKSNYSDPVEVYINPDIEHPTSRVLPLDEYQSSEVFLVRWQGSDKARPLVLQDYEIYVATNEKGPYALWIKTPATSAYYQGTNGATYYFYSIATDKAGNREGTPTTYDAKTTVKIPEFERGILLQSKEGETSIHIPVGALVQDCKVIIEYPSLNEIDIAVANFNLKKDATITPIPEDIANTYRRFKAIFPSSKMELKRIDEPFKLRIAIPYPDVDYNKVVDGTNIKVDTLKIFKLNQYARRWEVITKSYPIGFKHQVVADIDEFGVYRVMSYSPVTDLSRVYFYPNPFYPLHGKGSFKNLPLGKLTIKIYNIAGELVRTIDSSAEWDGRNDKGKWVGSGIYMYVIKYGSSKTTGKIGVIK